MLFLVEAYVSDLMPAFVSALFFPLFFHKKIYVMANPNIFNSVKVANPPRSRFDLSHDVKFSCNFGEFIPVLAMDCIPGDVVSIKANVFTRLAPLIAPVMGRAKVQIHIGFVANRLTWRPLDSNGFTAWENYIMSQPGFNHVHPFITVNTGSYNRVIDYMGVPPDGAGLGRSINVNAFPFAAYQKFWSDWFRDENLHPEDTRSWLLADGDNSTQIANLTKLNHRSWTQDYFTSSLPFTQKGTAVDIPIGPFPDVPVSVQPFSGAPSGTNIQFQTTPGGLGSVHANTQAASFGATAGSLYANTGILNAVSATMNDLRRAEVLQKFLERNAIGGTRPNEFIYAHFKMKPLDARLQRAEYITSTSAPIRISEVLSTAETDTLPQGNMSGHGFGMGHGRRDTYVCQEHGYIIACYSVIPEPVYSTSLPKHLLRINDPFEYAFPLLANLGEQPIVNAEIFPYTATDQDTFGYTSRYAEYKFMNSRVCADFRTSLAQWTFARLFTSLPTLNAAFIEMHSEEVDRIFAVTDPDVQKLYNQVLFVIQAKRALPYYGTPRLS